MACKKYRPDWYVFYRQQRGNAKQRGIEFLLTPDEWWNIWSESGHFAERGRGPDKYCMARFKDIGPYSIANVEITTGYNNNFTGSLGRKHSAETIKKMRLVHKGRQYNSYKLTVKDSNRAKNLLDKGISALWIANHFGVSKCTIYRAVNRTRNK